MALCDACGDGHVRAYLVVLQVHHHVVVNIIIANDAVERVVAIAVCVCVLKCYPLISGAVN